jgi:hypothetical protein
MTTGSMASMDTDGDDEETSPKTIKGEKIGREKSEREYAVLHHPRIQIY